MRPNLDGGRNNFGTPQLKWLKKERARVHFIPYLVVGVFVTLRAPDVIILNQSKISKKEKFYFFHNSKSATPTTRPVASAWEKFGLTSVSTSTTPTVQACLIPSVSPWAMPAAAA